MKPRVWVTRDEEPEGELSAALRSAGLDPVLEPVLERRLTANPGELIAALGGDDWLVITSAFAARAFRGAATPAKVAAVGEATEHACREAGLRVELVSPEATGKSLWPALWKRVQAGSTVCYPRSSLADVPGAPASVRFTAPVLYETLPRAFDAAVIGRVDAASLVSPSAVRQLARQMPLPPCASIGPTTSAAMRAHGIPVWVESSAHTFHDLANAIALRLRTPGRS